MIARIIDNTKFQRNLIFSLMAFIIFVFNFEAVFGLDVLLLDDNARYYFASKDILFNKIYAERSLLGPIKKYIDASLMLINPDAARLYYVLFFMIPLSFLLFIFSKNYLKIPYIPAITSAILVNILPLQLQTPKFIDGNGSIITILFLFAALIVGLKYLKAEKHKLWLLVSCLILYGLSNQIGGERGVFLFPAVCFLFLFYEGRWRDKIFLLSGFTAIIFLKIFWFLMHKSAAAATGITKSYAVMLYRFKKSVQWSLLFDINAEYALYAGIVLILIIIAGFYIGWKNSTDKRNIVLAYGFFGLFSVCSAFIFWTISPFFSVRYFFISHIGLWVLLSMALYHIVVTFVSSRVIMIGAFVSLVLMSGIQRHYFQVAHNDHYNRNHKAIMKILHSVDEIKPDAQIVITGKGNGTGGFFIWSSGYLRYTLKRNDVTGLIKNEKQFYDPFNVKHRGYKFTMEGLDIQKPLYAFRWKNKVVTRPSYYLQWRSNHKDADWVLYTLDENTDRLKVFHTGKGFKEYLRTLDESLIVSEEVMWGNYLAIDPKRAWEG